MDLDIKKNNFLIINNYIADFYLKLNLYEKTKKIELKDLPYFIINKNLLIC